MQATPSFHSFILKVASRCNINCSYCFIYNKDDTSWQKQPKLMAQNTVREIGLKILDHCKLHSKHDLLLILHGGEPLLGGIKHLRMIVETLESILVPHNIEISWGTQSNGLLFSDEIGEYFLSKNIKIGVSIDGPPEINDKYRVGFDGAPTSALLASKLEMLSSKKYRRIFSGLLCVISLEIDPIVVYDYFKLFRPPSVDFLLPYDNFDNLPPGKINFEDVSYGNWLIKLFDYWLKDDNPLSIRLFKSIISVLIGRKSYVESIGLDPVDLIVIETNGDIEAVDSLKATYNGATQLGLSIFKHSIDDAFKLFLVNQRFNGANSLNENCKRCLALKYCGGGYLPNRYSSENKFDNVSIFCRDLYSIISHVDRSLVAHTSSYMSKFSSEVVTKIIN